MAIACLRLFTRLAGAAAFQRAALALVHRALDFALGFLAVLSGHDDSLLDFRFRP